MVTPRSGNGSPLDHLPEELTTQLGQDTPLEDVVAASPYDLDADGMYTEGYLVLTADRLGNLHLRNGHW